MSQYLGLCQRVASLPRGYVVSARFVALFGAFGGVTGLFGDHIIAVGTPVLRGRSHASNRTF